MRFDAKQLGRQGRPFDAQKCRQLIDDDVDAGAGSKASQNGLAHETSQSSSPQQACRHLYEADHQRHQHDRLHRVTVSGEQRSIGGDHDRDGVRRSEDDELRRPEQRTADGSCNCSSQPRRRREARDQRVRQALRDCKQRGGQAGDEVRTQVTPLVRAQGARKGEQPVDERSWRSRTAAATTEHGGHKRRGPLLRAGYGRGGHEPLGVRHNPTGDRLENSRARHVR